MARRQGGADDPSLIGRHAAGGAAPLPLAVVSGDAVAYNVALMARWCADSGLLLAPHAKTTMSPQLCRMQLAAGAWGLTAATAWQAARLSVLRPPRLLIANEVVDDGSLALLRQVLDRDPELELLVYADSAAAYDAVRRGLGDHGGRVGVLLEVGFPGGRTGVRDDRQATALAEQIAAGPFRLRGLAAFEGTLTGATLEQTLGLVDDFLSRMGTLALELVRDGVLAPAGVVTVGGSSYVDRVPAVLGPALHGSGLDIVIRSGCYVTHDHGSYAATSPFGRSRRAGPALRPALAVIGAVLSVPEPGLVLAGLGRRDVGADAGLPSPLFRVRRSGTVREPVPPEAAVTAVNDQHAYCRFPPGSEPEVGDALGFGISHPCTTLDKWTSLAVVDDDLVIRGSIDTWF